MQTLSWLLRSELALVDAYARRFGDTFRIDPWMPRARAVDAHWPLVRSPVYFLSRPEDLKEVFRQPNNVLTGGDVREYLEWYYGSDCIITLDGAAHLQERRFTQNILSREWGGRSLARVTAAVTQRLERLPAHGRLSLAGTMQELSTRMSAALVFGELSERDAQRVCVFVQKSHDAIAWRALFLLFPMLRYDAGPVSPGGRMAALFTDFRKLVTERIDARRGAPPSDDILGRMLERLPAGTAAEADAVFMRVVAMFGAFDLVSAALCWSVYHLLDDAAARSRATREARSGAPLAGGFVEAVCMEALRLHPPFPVSMRRTTRPLVVQGLSMEAGARIAICMHLAHRRPEVFPEPDRFRPERFLEREFEPYEYLPFGGGAHRCLGHGFAIRHATAAIAELLRRFDVQPVRKPHPRARRRAIMLVPRDPLLAEMRAAG